MGLPSLPSGFDVSKRLRTDRADCQLTVGFDRHRDRILRFLVQLQYQPADESGQWRAIARMDHNEIEATGHDVYQEGLHVDVERRSSPSLHLAFSGVTPPQRSGVLIRECVEYFRHETDYFVDVYEERRPPSRPPSWSDGGNQTYRFISTNAIEEHMNQKSSEKEFVTVDELTELLAEAEDTTPEAIERGAEEFDIPPPEEATVIEGFDE